MSYFALATSFKTYSDFTKHAEVNVCELNSRFNRKIAVNSLGNADNDKADKAFNMANYLRHNEITTNTVNFQQLLLKLQWKLCKTKRHNELIARIE